MSRSSTGMSALAGIQGNGESRGLLSPSSSPYGHQHRHKPGVQRETIEACAIIFAAAFLSALCGFNLGSTIALPHAHLHGADADMLGA